MRLSGQALQVATDQNPAHTTLREIVASTRAYILQIESLAGMLQAIPDSRTPDIGASRVAN